MKNCPEDSQLADLLEGRLGQADLLELEQHIEACPTCAASLETLSGGDASLMKAIAAAGPDEFEAEHACLRITEKLVSNDAAPAADPPEQIGPYTILEQLGAGGMGTVFKARHQHLNRTVALKILRQERNTESQLRFEREMKVVGSIQHPHVVQATDGGIDDDRHFLVMEHLDGIDLGVVSDRRGKLAFPDACELIRQAAIGLQHIHEQSLVHRDIKPRNLMLVAPATESETPIVKILDLGLAANKSIFGEQTGELTGSGQILGTIDYMAPEQGLDSSDVDIRADIYGLGGTLYKLLAGEAPFPSRKYSSLGRKFNAILNDSPTPITEHRSDLPPALVDVLNAMMQRDREARPAEPREVSDLLKPFTDNAELHSLLQEPLRNAAHSKPPLQPPSPREIETSPNNAATLDEGRSSETTGGGYRKLALFAIPFGLILFSVIYIELGKCTLRVDVKHPDVSVQLEEDGIVIAHGQEIQVYPGEHQLLVKSGDLTFRTDVFELSRGADELVTIERLDGHLKVVRDSNQHPIGRFSIAPDSQAGDRPATTVSSSRELAAARWALEGYGRVQLVGDERWYEQIEDLPPEPFHIAAIRRSYKAAEVDEATFDISKIDVVNGLPHLREFSCYRGLHDDAVARLSNLPSLEILELALHSNALGEPQITDRSVEVISGFSLKQFAAAGTGLTDTGIATILKQPTMQHLERLTLPQSAVSSESLKAIAGLKELKLLRLERCNSLTATEFDLLKDLPIEDLDVNRSNLTSEMAMTIGKMRQLKILSISHTALTVADLEVLSRIPSLMEMRVEGILARDDAGENAKAPIPGFQFDEKDPNLLRRVNAGGQ